MKGVCVVVAALVCSLTTAIVPDERLNSKCLEWVSSNQKDLIILNQVASNSEISSCSHFCMIAGNGFKADTTGCKFLCDAAGGFEKFNTALSLERGFAAPEEMCKSMFSVTESDSIATSLLEVGVQSQQKGVEKRVGVRGDVTIQGTLQTQVLTSPIGDVKVSGELHVMNSIEANTASSAYVKALTGVSVKQGILSKKDQLLVKGKIDADSVTASGGLSYSFLEIDGVRQWALASLEDFEEVGVDGWSHAEVTECAGRKILGGHCVEKATPELSKTFEGLGPHTQLRIKAQYMFIDSWDGESGYLKADGNTVWIDSYNHAFGDPAHGINMCGNETPERKFSSNIDVTIPHTGDSITLAFGATTDEHSCDESFGIDSVMIFTR